MLKEFARIKFNQLKYELNSRLENNKKFKGRVYIVFRQKDIYTEMYHHYVQIHLDGGAFAWVKIEQCTVDIILELCEVNDYHYKLGFSRGSGEVLEKIKETFNLEEKQENEDS